MQVLSLMYCQVVPTQLIVDPWTDTEPHLASCSSSRLQAVPGVGAALGLQPAGEGEAGGGGETELEERLHHPGLGHHHLQPARLTVQPGLLQVHSLAGQLWTVNSYETTDYTTVCLDD